jgi:hypothetical protein
MRIQQRLVAIAQQQDALERQHLIKELAEQMHHSEEVEQIGASLLGENEMVQEAAIALLHALEMPLQLHVIPALLQVIVEADLNEGGIVWDVLEVLIAMGPPVLAHIMQFLREQRITEYLVVESLEKLEGIHWQHQEKIVQVLSQQPEAVVPFLQFVLRRPLKDFWEVCVLALIAIGYPHNAEAIPELMWMASSQIDFGAREAYDYLKEQRAVVHPFLIEALLSEKEESRYPKWEEVSGLLVDMGPEVVQLCGQVLLFRVLMMLSQHWGRTLFNLLSFLSQTYPEQVLLYLLELARQEPTSKWGKAAWELLNTFEPALLAPYTLVMNALRPMMEE